ncbi:hypothetical protein T439DRAFT_345959 [Meredithblackwellia eburnea MCA 4105]
MLSKSGLASFRWKLAPAAGTYATDPRWSNHDIDPVPVAARVWGTGTFGKGPFNFIPRRASTSYWVSDMLAPPLWTTISTVMSLGFSAKEVVPITFFGFFICGIAVALNGRIAATYHVPFPVIARTSFGMWGCIPMIFIRSTVALMWTAISIVQAGGFLQNMVVAIWPRFANWNHLPKSSNLTSGEILLIIIYWFIQTIVSMLPISKLRWFFIFKTWLVTPAWFAMFLWGAVITKGEGVLIKGPDTVAPGQRAWAALQALNVIIGLFSSLAVNMPDFARFSKNEKAGLYQALLLPVIGTMGALSPIFVTAAYQKQHGEYQWYLPVVIGSFDSRAAKFFAGFAFLVATLGNQIAAGSFPFGNDISGIFPQYVNIRRAAVLMSIFCLVSNPWTIIANAIAVLSFLSGYSIFMGPLAGIMICDYYILSKCKLSVTNMYNPNGIYKYWHGWNYRAYVAFFVPVIPLLPGLAYSIKPESVHVSPGILHLYSFGWLFGLTSSMLIYYVLCKYISPVDFRLLDEPEYPPRTLEEERLREEQLGVGSDSDSAAEEGKEKGDVAVSVV